VATAPPYDVGLDVPTGPQGLFHRNGRVGFDFDVINRGRPVAVTLSFRSPPGSLDQATFTGPVCSTLPCHLKLGRGVVRTGPIHFEAVIAAAAVFGGQLRVAVDGPEATPADNVYTFKGRVVADVPPPAQPAGNVDPNTGPVGSQSELPFNVAVTAEPIRRPPFHRGDNYGLRVRVQNLGRPGPVRVAFVSADGTLVSGTVSGAGACQTLPCTLPMTTS
jgi:hypothetical protein